MGVQGTFKTYKYQTEAGKIVKIRLQEETVAANPGGAANAEPAGAIDVTYPSAIVSRSRRGIGIHPRLASCRVIATGVSAANKLGSNVYIPILSKATTPTPATEGIYQGDTIEFIKMLPEIIG